MAQLVHVLYAGLGGHGSVLFTLLEKNFCKTWQHQVIFVGVEEPRPEYISRCESLGVPWNYVPKSSGSSHLAFLYSLYKTLLKTRADAFFLHGFAAVPAALLHRILSKKRAFVLLRETQAHNLKRPNEWIMLSIANIFFDRIVYLTDEAMAGAKKKLRFIHADQKSIIIGNGLDTDYFSPQNDCKNNTEIKIGMQSRLQSNKDHRTLINAYNLLRKKRPDWNISLHIAGDGATLASLKDFTQSLGISEHVKFHGMLNQDELRLFLASLSVYTHCTHGETMSTAIMQALSMGLPVIASNVFGVSNMIKNGNGLMYEPGNAEDLAQKIDTVLSDPIFGKTLADKARKTAINEYSNSALVVKYNNIFSSL